MNALGSTSSGLEFVMPANAGIQVRFSLTFKNRLDSGFRRNDGNMGRLPVDKRSLALKARDFNHRETFKRKTTLDGVKDGAEVRSDRVMGLSNTPLLHHSITPVLYPTYLFRWSVRPRPYTMGRMPSFCMLHRELLALFQRCRGSRGLRPHTRSASRLP